VLLFGFRPKPEKGAIMKRNNIYLKFIDETLKVIRGTRLPLYSSKYSKHTYDQHQLMVMILFKEYMAADYRSFIQRMELMYPILDKLELENIPHFTTLQKFVSRISTYKFNRILNQTVKLFYNRGDSPGIVAVDASGMTSCYASYYYSLRTDSYRKNFLKTSISVDTDKLIILADKITKNPTHDVKHAVPLLRLSHSIKKPSYYVMDKAYDSEQIHELIRDELGSYAFIPLRNKSRKKINGKYRKEMYMDFSEVIYFERNLVETVISVIKRLFGEEAKARKYRNQVKDVKTKLILYNIHRSIVNYDILIIIKVFYRAGLWSKPIRYCSVNTSFPLIRRI
jgi:hypothetical protein